MPHRVSSIYTSICHRRRTSLSPKAASLQAVHMTTRKLSPPEPRTPATTQALRPRHANATGCKRSIQGASDPPGTHGGCHELYRRFPPSRCPLRWVCDPPATFATCRLEMGGYAPAFAVTSSRLSHDCLCRPSLDPRPSSPQTWNKAVCSVRPVATVVSHSGSPVPVNGHTGRVELVRPLSCCSPL